MIHVEDLNVVGMVENRRLARAISAAGWGQFVRIIGEKVPLRSHRQRGVALAGVEQDVLDVRTSAGSTAATGPGLDVLMRGGPRPRL